MRTLQAIGFAVGLVAAGQLLAAEEPGSNSAPIVLKPSGVVEKLRLLDGGCTFDTRVRRSPQDPLGSIIISVKVQLIEAGSGAEKAGLKIGDQIIQVWDKDVVGMVHHEFRNARPKKGVVRLLVKSPSDRSARTVLLQIPFPAREK